MKDRLLIVAPSPSTFVVRDLKILSKGYVIDFAINPAQRRMSSIIALLKLPWKMIRSDTVLTWFADASYFPVKIAKMMGKRTIVIIAGYDVAKIESIGYGALLSEEGIRKVRWTLENTDAVVAVDQGLIEDLKMHLGKDFGAVVIPTGYDAERYAPFNEKKPLVLSVCSAYGRKGTVKGIDVFAECARRTPEVSFVLIGVTGDALKLLGDIPNNLEVIGNLSPDLLIPYYQKAKVYCQLSMREGLPNSVCEAMLCGCIVVGSDVQGIRTTVGRHGFLVPYGDVPSTCEAIKKALTVDDLGGREWIMSNFSEEKRAEKLFDLLQKLKN